MLQALNVSAASPAQQQAEWQQCRANLEKIGKAIESWQKEKGEVPNWLSDLVPNHLAERKTSIFLRSLRSFVANLRRTSISRERTQRTQKWTVFPRFGGTLI
jgi:hypothetical protein